MFFGSKSRAINNYKRYRKELTKSRAIQIYKRYRKRM
jgi:hypothetical protein